MSEGTTWFATLAVDMLLVLSKGNGLSCTVRFLVVRSLRWQSVEECAISSVLDVLYPGLRKKFSNRFEFLKMWSLD